MVFSYFLNCAITFRVRPRWRTFLLFPLSNLANVIVTTVGLPIAVNVIGVDERIAPLPVALTAIPVTYAVVELLMRAPRGGAAPQHRAALGQPASSATGSLVVAAPASQPLGSGNTTRRCS
jgi:hypothetical protein